MIGRPTLHHARGLWGFWALSCLGILWGWTLPPAARAETAPPDSTTLSGEGTRFPDMTVEGEDQIRIEFERPGLELELDPKTAPGLDRDRTLEIVRRGAPDPKTPLLSGSAFLRCPFLGRPWLTRFSAGPVATFRPKVSGVKQWSLSVADARGAEVAKFTGQGKAPEEIAWDGRTISGDSALPGLTYSYVFEAKDEAGNKRTMMGEGFTPGPYRREEKGGLVLLCSGEEILRPGGAPPILLEAASWVNQLPSTDSPVRAEIRARTRDEVAALSAKIDTGLRGRLIGAPDRLQIQAVTEADAPPSGACVIRAGGK